MGIMVEKSGEERRAGTAIAPEKQRKGILGKLDSMPFSEFRTQPVWFRKQLISSARIEKYSTAKEKFAELAKSKIDENVLGLNRVERSCGPYQVGEYAGSKHVFMVEGRDNAALVLTGDNRAPDYYPRLFLIYEGTHTDFDFNKQNGTNILKVDEDPSRGNGSIRDIVVDKFFETDKELVVLYRFVDAHRPQQVYWSVEKRFSKETLEILGEVAEKSKSKGSD